MGTAHTIQSSTTDRVLFRVAATFNGLVVLAFLAPGNFIWNLLGLVRPEQTIFLHLFLVFVALFGAAYFWIARDMSGKQPLILMGIVGKTAVVMIVLAHYLAGSIPFALVALGSGDLLFAFLFFRVLRRYAA